MTVMTKVIIDVLTKRTMTTLYDWSPCKPLAGWRWKVMRGWGVLKTLAGLPLRGRANGGIFYFAVSSGGGLYYDLLLAATARLLGYRVVAHHHAYSYFDRRDWRMPLLDRIVSSSAGAHAVHCELMRDDFLRQYPTNAAFLFVPPSIACNRIQQTPRTPHAQFTIGLLSNLSVAKGLDDAIETFALLADENRPVRLVLAGPCHKPDDRRLIDDAMARWPGKVEYRGPVYNDAKAQFFADIDAFIFPTRTESWGIVLDESLMTGCPVIARSQGCIPWIVRGGCGLVIDPSDDFPQRAAEQLRKWLDSTDEYAAARAAAWHRSQELENDAAQRLREFVERFVSLGAETGNNG